MVAGTQAPERALHIMLGLRQSARKYFHPPQSLLTLLLGRAQFWLRVVRTPYFSLATGGLRQ